MASSSSLVRLAISGAYFSRVSFSAAAIFASKSACSFRGELLHEEQRCFHGSAGRDEGVLRERDHGADEGAVLAELADVGERRVVEDALGEHDTQAAAGFQQVEAAFDEQEFGLDLAERAVSFGLGQFEQAGDGFVLGGPNAGQGLLVGVAIDARILAFNLVGQRDLFFQDLVRRLDIGAEGRIGEDDVEAAFEDAVDVEKAVVMVHAAVAVAVHDHVHLAGAGHAVVGVGAVDAAVGERPEPGSLAVVIEGGLDLVELGAEHGGLLLGGELLVGLDLGFVLLVLPVGVGQYLLAHDLEEPDQEAAGTAGRVADDLPFLGVHHAHHEFDDGARGEELADLAAEGLAQEAFECDALDVLAGVGQVVLLQQADDFDAGGGFQVQFLVGFEDAVGLVVLLGLLEQVLQRIVAELLLEELDAEKVLPLPLGLEFAFHEHLDEEDLGDFVERGDGVALLPVADDVVALVEQVGELVLLEDLQALDEFLDLLVGGVGVGNAVDLLHVLRHLVVENTASNVVSRWLWVTKKGAFVGGRSSRPGRSTAGSMVTLSALHSTTISGDVLGGLVLRGAPDDEVGAGLGRSSCP